MSDQALRLNNGTLHKCCVAFHFERDSDTDPWRAVRVYITHKLYSSCRYLDDSRTEKQLFSEYLKNVVPSIRSDSVVLNNWRRNYNNELSKIGLVINYYSARPLNKSSFSRITEKLFTNYVRCHSLRAMCHLAAMHHMRRLYLASAFAGPSPLRDECRQLLFEEFSNERSEQTS